MALTLDNVEVKKGFYKLVALDMDGTVLTKDKSVTQKTKDILKKAQDEGIRPVIVTGRPPCGIVNYAKEMGILHSNAYAVCYNGAAIVELNDFHDVYSLCAYGRSIKEVTKLAHKFNCKVHAYSKARGLVIEDLNPATTREVVHSGAPYTAIDFMQCEDNEPFYKILIVGPDEDLDKVRAAISPSLHELFTVMRSDPNFLEFIPFDGTKGKALGELCKILDIEIERTMAFGDAENDIEMVKMAGVGVAVANAMPTLKAVTPYRAINYIDDGVAIYLEQLFSLPPQA